MAADLKPRQPIEIEISYRKLFICIFVFALVFWAMGSIFRHYPVWGI